MRYVPFLRSFLLGSLGLLLQSCVGYPRIVNFPVDPGGRSLNSRALEFDPAIAEPYLVFASDRNGSQDIYLFDTSTRQTILLPGLNALNEIASHPAVSEDGRYIVFAVNRRGESDIYLYDREFEQKRNLTDNLNQEVRNPTISADGSKIAFEAAENGQWDILVYDRNGRQLDVE
ncbi:TolB family protein [Synechococcus sp. BDU 130192]|uniref:TolB family protein n=1 Tax=Synechococcus sp. BDU 130192 TaxID=2042059 RepID=UPI000C07530E|nr:TolB family protein [Synechococcus sp. BDU 130192]